MLERGYLSLSTLRPWWARLLLLFAIGSPLLGIGDLHPRLHVDHYFEDLLQWVGYATFISLFAVMCVGYRRFFDWLTVAILLGMTVVFTGALFRAAGIWTLISRLLGSAQPDDLESLMDLSFRLMVITVAYPLALLAVASFPASDILRWVSRRGAKRRGRLAIVAAVFLRMIQNVSEVVTKSLIAWREENPSVVLPRHRLDWHGSLMARVGFFDWVRMSVLTWILAVATQSMEAIPGVVRDFRRVGTTEFDST